ncbi:PROTEIN NRT1/ PTR FAMILY 1.3 [Salix koriyanagi]|uniref:PROTEIN NRT1/ PTR FAMILY 1.3 n=1 Tax=Salix koriyanagi TaxID=2511006 RepID=A0A9Q0W0V2_9ROSI|nr:PROTEIN NRT1/ PTR FAMILY 1.3 [Salix koriyanagi]
MEDPLDHKGIIREPLLGSSSKKGGVRALIFIIVNEAFERLANYGLSTNLILYLTREYRIDAVNGAQILYLHSAATNFTPFIGAFLADTYVGRFFMIGSGCIACLLALIYDIWSNSFKKRASIDDVYHHRKGSKLVVPTEKLRFLNKACVIRNPEEDLISDGRASNPWSLCTVDEVEELKSLIKVIPIWSTGVLMSINVLQHSFIVFQASTMDRHITSKFQVPAASFTAFQLFSSVIWIALYDRVAIPLASKIRGKPTRLSLKQRIGIGILSSSAAMAALAIIETARRETAIKDGFSDDPDAVLPISAMWLLLYFFITGFAEAFCGIGQNEFFYTELPKTMSSVASNLFEMGLSVSNLVAGLLVMIVRNFFKTKDQESWLSSNINKGHYDYYYWLLAGLSLVNFIYYRTCSKAYGPCKGQGGNATDEGEALTDEDS